MRIELLFQLRLPFLQFDQKLPQRGNELLRFFEALRDWRRLTEIDNEF
ncbi:hypothetical protein [Methylomicrobium lacus]